MERFRNEALTDGIMFQILTLKKAFTIAYN